MSARLNAHQLIETAPDDGSFSRWDTPPLTVPATQAYAEELARARGKSGVDEAVITGEGLIHGRQSTWL